MITREEIIEVAKSCNLNVPTREQINYVKEHYDSRAEEDPTGDKVLWIEGLLVDDLSQNKLSDSIRIARYMGMDSTVYGWYDSEDVLGLPYTNDNTFDDLFFHSSMDWISPVMKKIDEEDTIMYFEGAIILLRDHSVKSSGDPREPLTNFNFVVNYLNWRDEKEDKAELAKAIRFKDGWHYHDVTNIAKEVYDTGLFELYTLDMTSDSEALIESEEDLYHAIGRGYTIGIELGLLKRDRAEDPSTRVVIQDGYIYANVTDIAKDIFKSGVFELYLLSRNDGEEIEEYIDDYHKINEAQERGWIIGIRVGHP